MPNPCHFQDYDRSMFPLWNMDRFCIDNLLVRIHYSVEDLVDATHFGEEGRRGVLLREGAHITGINTNTVVGVCCDPPPPSPSQGLARRQHGLQITGFITEVSPLLPNSCYFHGGSCGRDASRGGRLTGGAAVRGRALRGTRPCIALLPAADTERENERERERGRGKRGRTLSIPRPSLRNKVVGPEMKETLARYSSLYRSAAC